LKTRYSKQVLAAPYFILTMLCYHLRLKRFGRINNTLSSPPFTQVPVKFIQKFASQISYSPSPPGKQTTEIQASQVESEIFLL